MEEDLKIINVDCLSNLWGSLYKIPNFNLSDQTEAWNKDNLKRKTTLNWNSSSTKPIWSAQRVRIKIPSNGRWRHQIKNVISQQPLVGSFPNFIVKLRETICSVQRLEMNTISYKRRHQNIEIRTAKQVMVRSCPNTRLKWLNWSELIIVLPNFIMKLRRSKCRIFLKKRNSKHKAWNVT